MEVSQIMSRNPICVLSDDTVENAARLMSQHNIGSLPVCSGEGWLRGMVTDRDIAVRCVAADFPASATKVLGVMTKAPITVESSADVRQAAQLMAEKQVRRLPVMENGRLVGMVTLGDLSKSGAFEMETGKALCEISENRKDY